MNTENSSNEEKGNGVLADVSSSAIALDDVGKALEEIRKFKDLMKFQSEKTDEFCKRYNIKSGQLNFLISVVGAERAKACGAMG